MARVIRTWRRAVADRDGDRREAADAAHRVAVLLEAGVSPASAWGHLAAQAPGAEADAGAAVRRIADDVAAGLPAERAIAKEGPAWQDLARAWRIAAVIGAPLADALRSFAAAHRDALDTADEVRAALVEPTATAHLMSWLPVAGVLLGLVLGFDTIGVLLTNSWGHMCLIAGAALMLLARAWTRRLVRQARPPEGIPGFAAELFAIAVGGGASIHRARELVLGAVGADEPVPAAVDGLLDLSRRAGVPAGELLRAHAVDERRVARAAGRERAARLATRLVLPLGVCTLPAFLAWGVAPIAIAIVSATDLPLPAVGGG